MSKRTNIVREIDKRIKRAEEESTPIAIGGGTVLATRQHAIDGPEHTGFGGDAGDVLGADGVFRPTAWKPSVRVATTAAGTLATSFENGDTIDGVVLATGDRILLKDQAAGATNGIYVVAASGAPTRAEDLDDSADALGAAVFVTEGTTNGNKAFFCTTNAPITLGTTTLVFAAVSGGGGHTVQENSAPLTARTNLNFQDGIVATDDAGNDQTDVNLDFAEDADISTQAFGDAASASASLEVAPAGHKHAMPGAPIVNTDADPGKTIYVGFTDPDGTYTLYEGDVWIERA